MTRTALILAIAPLNIEALLIVGGVLWLALFLLAWAACAVGR